MKKLIIVLSIALCLLAATCKKEKGGDLSNIKVSDNQFSDCLMYPMEPGKYLEVHDQDSLIVRYEDGTVYVEHYNLTVNCGFEKVYVNVKTKGDTIRIKEWDLSDDANCMCKVINGFHIDNVPHGTYVFVIENWFPAPYQETFTF